MFNSKSTDRIGVIVTLAIAVGLVITGCGSDTDSARSETTSSEISVPTFQSSTDLPDQSSTASSSVPTSTASASADSSQDPAEETRACTQIGNDASNQNISGPSEAWVLYSAWLDSGGDASALVEHCLGYGVDLGDTFSSAPTSSTQVPGSDNEGACQDVAVRGIPVVRPSDLTPLWNVYINTNISTEAGVLKIQQAGQAIVDFCAQYGVELVATGVGVGAYPTLAEETPNNPNETAACRDLVDPNSTTLRMSNVRTLYGLYGMMAEGSSTKKDWAQKVIDHCAQYGVSVPSELVPR